MKKTKPLLLFFLLSYLISWIIWLPLYLPSFEINNLPVLPFHHSLGAAGPITAAFIVSLFENKNHGLRDLFNKMIFWRVPVFWYFIALFSPFILLGIASLLLGLIDHESISLNEVMTSDEFPQFSFFLFFLYNVISFGYGEETGWRGFALPRLQETFSPKIATLILSLFWAGWHIPLFLYRPGYSSMDVGGIAGWVMSILTGAILLSWIYNKTSGSILIAALFHATIDIVFTSQASSGKIVNYLGFLITLWGIATWFLLTKKSLPLRST